MINNTPVFLFQLFDSEKLELLKTYRTERPVNSASISPLRDNVSGCVIFGGNRLKGDK